MDEDFNNLFEEQENEIDTIKKEAEMNNVMYDLKIKLANENYESIISKGVDFKLMEKQELDIKPIVKILGDMLELFEEREEYEKCAKINKILKKAKVQ
jgi:hypothetical protein